MALVAEHAYAFLCWLMRREERAGLLSKIEERFMVAKEGTTSEMQVEAPPPPL